MLGLAVGRPGGNVRLQTLDHVGLAVSDVDRSIQWYERVLGLRRAFEDAWGSYPAVLVADQTGVALFPARGRPIEPSTFDSLPHAAFRISPDGFARARQELEAAGIEFRESDHQIARSLYVLDPDSHLIEITAYISPHGA
jgi:catechol 2,3-dioxygenase-like lactoylglutathione lyase family enzyme